MNRRGLFTRSCFPVVWPCLRSLRPRGPGRCPAAETLRKRGPRLQKRRLRPFPPRFRRVSAAFPPRFRRVFAAGQRPGPRGGSLPAGPCLRQILSCARKRTLGGGRACVRACACACVCACVNAKQGTCAHRAPIRLPRDTTHAHPRANTHTHCTRACARARTHKHTNKHARARAVLRQHPACRGPFQPLQVCA